MPEDPKKISCPNCSGIAIKEGNKIICETCDATFTITKTGAGKVKKKDVGRLDSLEERMDHVESLLPNQEPEPDEPQEPEPDEPQEPEPDDDSILGPE